MITADASEGLIFPEGPRLVNRKSVTVRPFRKSGYLVSYILDEKETGNGSGPPSEDPKKAKDTKETETESEP